MWKALIKLVEKWAYRCEHDWIKISEVRIMDEYSYSNIPVGYKQTYRCTKCCEFKKIKL